MTIDYNNELKNGYAKSISIIRNLSENIKPPETNGELGELPYHEQYNVYQAQTEILDKACFLIEKHALKTNNHAPS